MLDEETMAEMLNDKEVSNIIKRVFAHAKFGKSKNKTVPAKPEDGFDTKIAQEGRNKGYELGQQDFKKYVDYDDNQVQMEFEKTFPITLRNIARAIMWMPRRPGTLTGSKRL